MAVAKAEILDAISNMTVLELSQLIKDMEEKFGVSAAAATVAVAAPAAAGARRAGSRRADRVHRDADRRRREQGQRDQGRARGDRPGPEGSQGPGRRRAKPVKEAVSKADAEAILKQLIEAGGDAEIK